MNLYLIIAGIAVCIALSAFCSSSEMAYSSCNTDRKSTRLNSSHL